MTGNLKLLCNFVEKFLGTVHFGNDQFAPILGYGDLIQGNVTIKRVYYVEGLNHNLFSVGQFCDADLEFQRKAKFASPMDLCGPMALQSNKWEEFILVIVVDYSDTLGLFLYDPRGTEFLNKTLHAYFKEEGIEHQTSTPRTPEQNGVCRKTEPLL
ncbi:retrovirus-related pol polyprotein from transposon TNT 1-94 [Tanacetum coccineum]